MGQAREGREREESTFRREQGGNRRRLYSLSDSLRLHIPGDTLGHGLRKPQADTHKGFFLHALSANPMASLRRIGQVAGQGERGLCWLWSSALLMSEASRWGCVLNLVAENELYWNAF